MILTQLAYLTSGVCLECFMNGTGRYLRETELRHEARQRSIKLKSTVPSRRGVKKNAVTTKNGRLVEHAKRAAFRRLRSWVPDLWDIAYALEREARGLPCLPLRKPPGHFVEAVATAARNGVYAPGSSGGVSGAQDEDPGTAGQ